MNEKSPTSEMKTFPEKLKEVLFVCAVPVIALTIYFIVWLPGVFASLKILQAGSAPDDFTWVPSTEALIVRTIHTVIIMALSFLAFFIYSLMKKQTYTHTLAQAGLRLRTRTDAINMGMVFSTWFITFFAGNLIASLVNEAWSGFYEFPLTNTALQDPTIFLLSAIQAGPDEEIALVPLIVMSGVGAMQIVSRQAGKIILVCLISIAVIGRIAFHLYYGVGAIVAEGIWAAGLILAWFLWRNVWGAILAHSLNNALSALSLIPGWEFLGDTKIFIYLACVIFMLVNNKNFTRHWNNFTLAWKQDSAEELVDGAYLKTERGTEPQVTENI